MTALAGGRTMTCDYAGCDKAGTVEHEAWMFCDDHTSAGKTLGAPTAPVRPRPTAVAPARPVAAPLTPGPQPAAPAVQAPSPIGLLLEEAGAHSVPKIRRLAERIEGQLDDLRALLREHAEQEKQRRADEERQAKARAEVERLEAQLAKAREAAGLGSKKKAAGKRRSYTLTDKERARRSEQLREINARRKAERGAATATS